MAVNEDKLSRILSLATEQSFRYSGAGSLLAQYQTILSKIDRFGINLILQNTVHTGLTFITRPKLNLTTANLRQDSIMSMLDSRDPTTIPFVIRCLLDSAYARRRDIAGIAYESPLLDNRLPFITPLTNCLVSIHGFPNWTIDTATTDGGFFGEDQTIAKGSDRLNRTYDIPATIREIQGGFNKALVMYWLRAIDNLTKGIMFAYPEDIENRRMCYTVSIYRFLLDPSRRHIMEWAKATGCFPVSDTQGDSFNISERENFVSANTQFTVNFKANHIEYMEPSILTDFNTIMKRYAGYDYAERGYVEAPNEARYNFAGLPYIDIAGGLNELKFLCTPEELVDPFDAQLEQFYREFRAT